jgi:predicted alpha/beta superfamily hydrolase
MDRDDEGTEDELRYVELPGEDHGSIIAKRMPSIYAFLASNAKK